MESHPPVPCFVSKSVGPGGEAAVFLRKNLQSGNKLRQPAQLNPLFADKCVRKTHTFQLCYSSLTPIDFLSGNVLIYTHGDIPVVLCLIAHSTLTLVLMFVGWL